MSDRAASLAERDHPELPADRDRDAAMLYRLGPEAMVKMLDDPG